MKIPVWNGSNHAITTRITHILAFQNLQDLWSRAGSPSSKSVACRATDAGQTDAPVHLCGLLAHRGGWTRGTDMRARLRVKVDARHKIPPSVRPLGFVAIYRLVHKWLLSLLLSSLPYLPPCWNYGQVRWKTSTKMV